RKPSRAGKFGSRKRLLSLFWLFQSDANPVLLLSWPVLLFAHPDSVYPWIVPAQTHSSSFCLRLSIRAFQSDPASFLRTLVLGRTFLWLAENGGLAPLVHCRIERLARPL